jgi:hypothetical protein
MAEEIKYKDRAKRYGNTVGFNLPSIIRQAIPIGPDQEVSVRFVQVEGENVLTFSWPIIVTEPVIEPKAA